VRVLLISKVLLAPVPLSFPTILVFLYASTAVEGLTFALLFNELFELGRYEDFLELQTCLVGMAALCMVSLAMMDGVTIYKEVSFTFLLWTKYFLKFIYNLAQRL